MGFQPNVQQGANRITIHDHAMASDDAVRALAAWSSRAGLDRPACAMMSRMIAVSVELTRELTGKVEAIATHSTGVSN